MSDEESASSPSGRERRGHPRVVGFDLVSFEEFYPGGGPSQMGIGRSTDLSLGGVGIESAKPLPLGSTIKLRIAIRDRIVEAEGRVVNLEEVGPGKVRIGVRFTSVPPTTREFLQGFTALEGGQVAVEKA